MDDHVAETMSITRLHHDALASTRRFVSGIQQDRWHDPTPCAEWDVRQLLNHIVAGNLWAAELASGSTIGEVGDRLDGDQVTDSPLTAYDHSARAADHAFAAPGALDSPCSVSYGPVPGSVYAGHRFVDVLIHGWDIAVATGQDPALDPELVEACWNVVQPQLDQFSASGMFGSTAVDDPGADTETRLLGALGRSGRS